MGSLQQLLFAIGWFACTAVAAAAEAPHIAIISSPDAADLSTLIVTELSNDPDIAVVERDELAKAGDELKQQTLARSDATALGKLIGADGLLFINKTAEAVQIRFTAVGLGYALFEDRLDPTTNLAEQAKSIAHRMGSYASKLKLKPDQVTPISVLNLRAELVTSNSSALERKLTLLLESRLASLPNCIVLERRHAWSVGFERTLSTSSTPLLQGAYLVDGSLTFPTNDAKDLTVHLRLRSPNGQKTPFEIHGPLDNLPTLVEQMTAAIQKVTGTSATASAWQPQTEAAEYLQEGIWAWRNGQPKAALEALDSAELLGEKTSDLLAVRIRVLCHLGGDVADLQSSTSSVDWMDRHWPYNRNSRMPSDPRPEERLEQVLRAINDLDRYKREDGERHLGNLKYLRSGHTLTTTQDGKTDVLEKYVLYASSKVFLMLRELQHPRSAELQQTIRALAGYDPLHEKMPVGGIYALQYADTWSETPEEVFSYYRILYKELAQEKQLFPENPMYGTKEELDRMLLRDGSKEFCTLFAKTPEERQKLFDQFINELIADPQSKAFGLLLRATWSPSTEQKTAYLAYLSELWQNREKLSQSGELTPLLKKTTPLQYKISKPADQQLIGLIHYYLQQESKSGPALPIWAPELFPPVAAPSLWKDLQECKKRCLVNFREGEGTGRREALNYFSKLEKLYTDRFGNPDGTITQAQTPPRVLEVNRFWHGGLAPGANQMELQDLYGARGADDILWVYGYDEACYHDRSKGEDTPVRASLFKIHLPDLKTESIPLPSPVYPWKLRSTTNFHAAADGIYIVSNRDSNPQIGMIDRYSFASQKWEHHEIEIGIEWLYFIDGKIYLSFAQPNSGIGRHDWEKNQTVILANSRRRPALNQLDDRIGYTVSDIFLSSDGKVCVQLMMETLVVQETPGKWTPGPPVNISQGIPTEPKVGIFRGMFWHDATEEPTFDPQSHEADWFRSGYARARSSGDIVGYGYRGKEIFMVSKKSTSTLWWLKPGNANPSQIPLDLKIDEKTHAILKSCFDPNTFQFIDTPTVANHQVKKLIVTDQGICLFSIYAGFWFIPFSDIDAYLKQAESK